MTNPDPVKQAIERIAAELATRLFTTGLGEHARRLVFELPDYRAGGGWGESSARDQIIAKLAPVETLLRAAHSVVGYNALRPTATGLPSAQAIDGLREAVEVLMKGGGNGQV